VKTGVVPYDVDGSSTWHFVVVISFYASQVKKQHKEERKRGWRWKDK